MLFEKGYRIGRIFGIDIAVTPSWFAVFALLVWSLTVDVFPRLQPSWPLSTNIVLSIISVGFFFASLLTHELAHSLVARREGLPVHTITLFLFGGVSHLERDPERPRDEFWMAIAGPMTSIGLSILFFAVHALVAPYPIYAAANVDQLTATPVAAVLSWLASVNLLIGLFNLVPGFPLDGGRVLRALLWGITGSIRTASLWAHRLGQAVWFGFIFIGLLMVFGVEVPLFGVGWSGLWLILMGTFLTVVSRVSYEQTVLLDALREVPIARVMHSGITLVAADASVRELFERYVVNPTEQVAAVMDGRRLIGFVFLNQLVDMPVEVQGNTPIREVMVARDDLAALTPTDTAAQAIHTIREHKVPGVPIMREGKVLGTVSLEAIAEWAQYHLGRPQSA